MIDVVAVSISVAIGFAIGGFIINKVEKYVKV